MGRRAVIPERLTELMGAQGRHCWTLEDLQEGLAGQGFAADPSSVFRAVGRLEDEGVVRRVELDDRRSRFELTGAHHEHLVCQRCGAVEALPCAVVEAIVEQARQSVGFTVTAHRVVLTGTCRACSARDGA